MKYFHKISDIKETESANFQSIFSSKIFKSQYNMRKKYVRKKLAYCTMLIYVMMKMYIFFQCFSK